MIRVKALCLFHNDHKFLLSQGYDPAKDEHYLRPIGGSIEFGETSKQAIEREVLEEIGQAIHTVELLDVIENLFTFDGKQGHEIIFVYQAKFVDMQQYQISEFVGCETDGSKYLAKWYDQTTLAQYPIYPTGIVKCIT